jgi:hypothetical protein
MHSVTKSTPSLATTLHAAAQHVSALTAGPNSGGGPTTNVKIPSTAQSILEYEMEIVTNAMKKQRMRTHASSNEHHDRSHSPEPSLLDLSSDSSLEWEQLEPRESITIVQEISERILSDLLISTVSVLKNIHNKRSSVTFQEQMSL